MKISHFTSISVGFFFFLFCLGVWRHDIDIIIPGIMFSLVSLIATKAAISENF